MIQIFVLLRLNAAILLSLGQETLIKQVRRLLIEVRWHIHISREGAFLDQLLRVVHNCWLAVELGVISALATGKGVVLVLVEGCLLV